MKTACLFLVDLYNVAYYLLTTLDNMPVTWCFFAEKNEQYCDTGFPMGCYIDKDKVPREACGLIPEAYREADTYYVFNHVELVVSYHSGKETDWGSQLGESGRIICE